jgi:hypothetical protein
MVKIIVVPVFVSNGDQLRSASVFVRYRVKSKVLLVRYYFQRHQSSESSRDHATFPRHWLLHQIV